VPPAARRPFQINRVLLWYAFLGPPVIWLVHIGARYPLVPTACAHDFPLALHVVTLATLAAMIGAAVAAGAILRRARSSPNPEARVAKRARYMAVVGLALAVLFSIVIVAELLPALMQDPCVDVRL
jgi:hypothetical protein